MTDIVYSTSSPFPKPFSSKKYPLNHPKIPLESPKKQTEFLTNSFIEHGVSKKWGVGVTFKGKFSKISYIILTPCWDLTVDKMLMKIPTQYQLTTGSSQKVLPLSGCDFECSRSGRVVIEYPGLWPPQLKAPTTMHQHLPPQPPPPCCIHHHPPLTTTTMHHIQHRIGGDNFSFTAAYHKLHWVSQSL